MLINGYSVKISNRVMIVFTIAKLVSLGIIIVGGLVQLAKGTMLSLHHKAILQNDITTSSSSSSSSSPSSSPSTTTTTYSATSFTTTCLLIDIYSSFWFNPLPDERNFRFVKI